MMASAAVVHVGHLVWPTIKSAAPAIWNWWGMSGGWEGIKHWIKQGNKP